MPSADAELLAAVRGGEPQRQPHVVGQHEEEQDGDIGEVAVDVLQHQREPALAAVARAARLAHRARDRIRPERLVVGAAVVVAGEAEEPGERQDEERRRERQQRRPPGRLGPEPGVLAFAEDHRRVERRQIGPEGVVRVLKRRPGRVDDEAAQHQEDHQRLHPPRVAPVGLTEPARDELDRNCFHPQPPCMRPHCPDLQAAKPLYVSRRAAAKASDSKAGGEESEPGRRLAAQPTERWPSAS